MNTENPLNKNLDRRSFLKRSSLLGAALLPTVGLLSSVKSAHAALSDDTSLSDGDIAVLQFLRAAEFIEADLWGQYAELAVNNLEFRTALKEIDPTLPDYVVGDHADELSHANLITGFLVNAGVTPVDLSSFYTLPAAPVRGVDQSVTHLTSLTNLSIDTSWYLRYRNPGNPDFGDTFPQIATINNRPAVPTSNHMNRGQLHAIAQTAAFHFGFIEQGGSSLYLSLLPKVSNLDVVSILGAIGPTEFYHFALFQTALEGITGASEPGLSIPNLRRQTTKVRGDTSEKILTPNPCTFLDPSLPVCSVIRPSNTANAGAVAVATALVNQGLFTGQSSDFLDAAVALALAADAATRSA